MTDSPAEHCAADLIDGVARKGVRSQLTASAASQPRSSLYAEIGARTPLEAAAAADAWGLL